MIKTKLFNSDNPQDVEASINLFIEEEQISIHELIDIKYAQVATNNPDYREGFIKYIFMFSALIIYNKKAKPFKGKENLKINDPYAQPRN